MQSNNNLTSTTLICSVHHRRCPPFEDGIERLATLGFERVWILDTGEKEGVARLWGDYQGPCEKIVKLGPLNIAMALRKFWAITLPKDIERILFLDNDCFIFDPNDTLEYVRAFVEKDYDLVTLSSFRDPLGTPNGDIIIPISLQDVIDQAIKTYPLDPKTCPRLAPGAIAYSIFDRKFWGKIKDPNVQFNLGAREFWKKLCKYNPKFGVHRMDKETVNGCIGGEKYLKEREKMFTPKGTFKHGYSQFELGRWLHFGNFMGSYYKVERNKQNLLSDLDKGFFCKYFPYKIDCDVSEKRRLALLWDSFITLAGSRTYE